MSQRLQRRRTAFAIYLGTCYLAILLAAPVVRALEPALKAQQAATQGSASAGSGSLPRADAERRSFEECDRNGDGLIDKSEAGGVPGLSANFERADLNQDGRLDREEFRKALALLESQKK